MGKPIETISVLQGVREQFIGNPLFSRGDAAASRDVCFSFADHTEGASLADHRADSTRSVVEKPLQVSAEVLFKRAFEDARIKK